VITPHFHSKFGGLTRFYRTPIGIADSANGLLLIQTGFASCDLLVICGEVTVCHGEPLVVPDIRLVVFEYAVTRIWERGVLS